MRGRVFAFLIVVMTALCFIFGCTDNVGGGNLNNRDTADILKNAEIVRFDRNLTPEKPDLRELEEEKDIPDLPEKEIIDSSRDKDIYDTDAACNIIENNGADYIENKDRGYVIIETKNEGGAGYIIKTESNNAEAEISDAFTQWRISLTNGEVLNALQGMGLQAAALRGIDVAVRNKDGRAGRLMSAAKRWTHTPLRKHRDCPPRLSTQSNGKTAGLCFTAGGSKLMQGMSLNDVFAVRK